MYRSIAFGACAFALAAVGASASPLPDGGVTAGEVAAVLKARGLPATIGKDKQGDPMVSSKIGAVNFQVYFYTCRGSRCAAIQFSKGYNLESGISCEQVDTWNRKKRYGKVHRDSESDPYIQMDIDVERGSTTESIANNLETWIVVLEQFSEYINWGGDAESPTT